MPHPHLPLSFSCTLLRCTIALVCPPRQHGTHRSSCLCYGKNSLAARAAKATSLSLCRFPACPHAASELTGTAAAHQRCLPTRYSSHRPLLLLITDTPPGAMVLGHSLKDRGAKAPLVAFVVAGNLAPETIIELQVCPPLHRPRPPRLTLDFLRPYTTMSSPSNRLPIHSPQTFTSWAGPT